LIWTHSFGSFSASLIGPLFLGLWCGVHHGGTHGGGSPCLMTRREKDKKSKDHTPCLLEGTPASEPRPPTQPHLLKVLLHPKPLTWTLGDRQDFGGHSRSKLTLPIAPVHFFGAQTLPGSLPPPPKKWVCVCLCA
jgi:hypothetical protein